MVDSVTDKDLRALVQLVEDGRSAYSESEPGTGLPSGLLEDLKTLVPCDDVTFLELTPAGCDIAHMQGWPEPEADSTDGESVDADDPFWTHYWDCDAVSYPSVTGDTRSVTTISDFYSLRQWRDTSMHAEVLRDIKHRIMLCLSAPEGRERRLLLFRSTGSDFDERDRLLLGLLRPHIDELYQHLQRLRVAGSTLRPRQREILTLVAKGMSNSQIAAELGLSTTTVRTHLEHIFDRLDVSNRTAAVAKAFPAPPH